MWYVMAREQQSYDLSDRLIRAIGNWNTLTGSDDDVEQLLDLGADVNRLHGTLLPLHCACMVVDPFCVSLLLERGAQVNAIDGFNRAAIHYAAEKDEECLEILLDHGAVVDMTDANSDTALHWAAFKDNARCIRLLLHRGADPNVTDYNNDTPLSWAAIKGNLESIKVLLEYNAKVDTVNMTGQSPLFRATYFQAAGLNSDKDDAALELIFKASGQIDIRDENGELPNAIMRDNKLHELFLPACTIPSRLQKLCRFAVRNCLGRRFLPNVVPKLPIPTRLQEYLLLQR